MRLIVALQRYYSVIRLPSVVCTPRLFSLCVHTRFAVIGLHVEQEQLGSHWLLHGHDVSRDRGLRPRGPQAPLAITRDSVLPSAGPNAWADSKRNMHFGAQYHSRFGRPAQSIRPRDLSVYASTPLLPLTLQHSIPSLRLRATRTGFPPACQ
jgi:hypothetical protein